MQSMGDTTKTKSLKVIFEVTRKLVALGASKEPLLDFSPLRTTSKWSYPGLWLEIPCILTSHNSSWVMPQTLTSMVYSTFPPGGGALNISSLTCPGAHLKKFALETIN